MAVVDIIIRTIDQSNGDIGKLSGKLGQLAAKYLGLGAVAAGTYKIIKDSIETTLKYDEAVRLLAEVSGTGAEESSRLLQVMDDFKLTAGDVTAATRAMTKQGLSPTLETLAQLSDEYKLLNPGQERADFLLKNFGRTGLQFAEAMSKGGESLRQMGQEVEKSLIRTDAQIAKTRLAELEFDRWTDKVEAFKVTLGSDFIGFLDGSTEAIQRQAQEIFKAANGYEYNTNMANRYTPAQRAAWEEAQKSATQQYLLSQGVDLATESIDNQTPSLEEQARALEELTLANQNELATLEKMTGIIDAYKDQQADLKKEHDELVAKKAELIAQGWWAESEAVQEVNRDLEENTRKQQEYADEFQMATNRRILARAEELASIDGLTTEEKNRLIERGIAMGVYTQEAAQRMREEEQAAKDLAASLNNIPNVSRTVTISTFYENYGGANVSAAQQQMRGRGTAKHAAGGVFEIPQSYGYEGFPMGGRDTASGGEKLAIAPQGQDFIDYKRLGKQVGKSVAYELAKRGG